MIQVAVMDSMKGTVDFASHVQNKLLYTNGLSIRENELLPEQSL